MSTPTLIRMDLTQEDHSLAWSRFPGGHPLCLTPVNVSLPDEADSSLRWYLAKLLYQEGNLLAVPSCVGDLSNVLGYGGDPNGSEMTNWDATGNFEFCCYWGDRLEAKMTSQDVTFLYWVEQNQIVADLRVCLMRIEHDPQPLDPDLDLTGVTFCFTGVRDEELSGALQSAGAEELTSVTSRLTWLIAKDPQKQSGKSTKAKSLGIPVVAYHDVVGVIL